MLQAVNIPLVRCDHLLNSPLPIIIKDNKQITKSTPKVIEYETSDSEANDLVIDTEANDLVKDTEANALVKDTEANDLVIDKEANDLVIDTDSEDTDKKTTNPKIFDVKYFSDFLIQKRGKESSLSERKVIQKEIYTYGNPLKRKKNITLLLTSSKASENPKTDVRDLKMSKESVDLKDMPSSFALRGSNLLLFAMCKPLSVVVKRLTARVICNAVWKRMVRETRVRLPDIEEVRRVNRSLLTAQVAPNAAASDVPVCSLIF